MQSNIVYSESRDRLRFSASNIRIADFLYYCYLFSVVIISTIGLTSSSKFYVGVVAIGAVLAITRLLSLKYNRKSFIALFLLAGIGFIELLVTRRVTLLLTALLLLGAKDLHESKLLGAFLYAKIAGLILLVVLATIGIIPIEIHQYYKMGVGQYITRIYVNGSGTNVMHLSFLAVWFLYFYKRDGKLSLIAYIVFIIANYFVENITGSYVGLVLGYLSVALFMICQYSKHFRAIFIKYCGLVLPLVLIFSFGTALLYGNNDLLNTLDRFFQGRIYYDHYFITSYPFSLFGNGMLNNEGNFDNSFIFIWVCYGAVAFCILFWAVQRRILQLREEQKWISLLLLTLYLIAGISESFYPAAAINPSLFLLVPLFSFNDETTSINGETRNYE